MRGKKLKQLIACALICSSLISVTSITAKAEAYVPNSVKYDQSLTSVEKLYEKTYNLIMRIEDVASAYNITPRHNDDGTSLESNSLKSLDKAVNNENLQVLINEGRFYLKKFPNDMWQARNTFSNILDGYQQPIFEHIVNVINKLEKATKQDSVKFDASTKWNKEKVNSFEKVIKQREMLITMARNLNSDVDPTYATCYSTALDAAQQRVIDLVVGVVEKAKVSIDPKDIANASSVVEVFYDSVYYDNQLRKYALSLNEEVKALYNKIHYINNPVLQEKIGAMQYELNDLKKVKTKTQLNKQNQTISSLQGKILFLKNKIEFYSGNDFYYKIKNIDTLIEDLVSMYQKNQSMDYYFDKDEYANLITKIDNELTYISNRLKK